MREEGENPPDLLYLPRARNTISTITELRGAGRIRIRLVQDTKRGGRGGRRKGRGEGRAGMEWETGEERRVKECQGEVTGEGRGSGASGRRNRI